MVFGVLGLGEFYSLLCAVVWAFAIILFRKSGERVSPIALNVFKTSFALGLFLVTLPLVGVPYWSSEIQLTTWFALFLSGAIGIGIADTMFFESLNRLGAANAAIVDCLYSPFVFMCAAIYLHEPMRLSVILALLLMVFAIVVGTWEPRSNPARLVMDRRNIIGVVLGILAALFMAIGIVIAKPALASANAWWATTVRLTGGLAFLSVRGAVSSDRKHIIASLIPSRQWFTTVPAAVIGTYFALFLWISGMKLTFASVSSVLTQTSTIFVMIFAAIFLKERLTGRKIAAVCIAFVGVVFAAR